ncbi:MAG: Mth938-like domain-containing protein [Methylophilus sp.]|nr:Mth938-like domain-containing protein [Methylophilus sp.]
MKLHLTTSDTHHLITACGDGFVQISQKRYEQNLVVTPTELILDWHHGSFSALDHEHFEKLILLNPEVVLLGTGSTHCFLHPKQYAHLTEHHIPIECMTTAAACRTYNILMSEGRKVVAALIL